MQRQPKIGVIGTGAVAGFYGLMLQRAGVDVRFLARSDYEVLARQGMSVESDGLGRMRHQIQVCREIEQLADCDWILVATKSTANQGVAELLRRLPSGTAKVVLMQNGFANEQTMRSLLPAGMQLFAGLCFIYARRTAPGQIQHQGGGTINIGYHSGSVNGEQGLAQANRLMELFNMAGVKARYVDVLPARWQKLVWNIPYNGLSVVLNASTSALMDNSASRELVVSLMEEVRSAAAACGFPLTDNLVPAMLKSTADMADYFPSMYADFHEGRELELQSIYQAPLVAAGEAGETMPKTRMLLQQLEFLQQQKQTDKLPAAGLGG